MRRPPPLRPLPEAGGWAYADKLDVTEATACKAFAERIGREIGAVDLLANNAGIIIREGSDSPKAEANWRVPVRLAHTRLPGAESGPMDAIARHHAPLIACLRRAPGPGRAKPGTSAPLTRRAAQPR